MYPFINYHIKILSEVINQSLAVALILKLQSEAIYSSLVVDLILKS
jgi:hypothetical protein